MALQAAGRGDYPVRGTNWDTAGCGAGGGDVVREEGQGCLELPQKRFC